METIYRTAPSPWNLSDNRGNHRVVVSVPEPGEYVKIRVRWRRRDIHPERCGIMARRISDDRAVNVKAVFVTREAGEFVLEAPDAGEYALYYMPCRRLGDSWWNPVMEYAKEAFPGCDSAWEENIPQDMPEGKVLAIESRTEFDSFYPMELPASPEETKNLLEMAGSVPFVLFPEDRQYPVRMLYELPYRWIERGLLNEFCGNARPDEYYVFQLAVLARENLDDISVEYHGSAEITCFNRDGVDWLGHPFAKKLSCSKGRIQPLWFGL